MGAALIGAGVLVFLAANWGDLPTWVRTAILIGIPVGFASAAVLLDREGLPRAGLGTWVLASIAVGPSVILLFELYELVPENHVPFAIWGAVALPMGHVFRTRLSTGVGILALLAAAALLPDGQTGPLMAGFFGILVIAAPLVLDTRAPELVGTYRLLGVATTIAVALWIALAGGAFETITIAWEGGFVLAVGLAAVVGAVAVAWWRIRRLSRPEALLIVVPLIGMALLLGVVSTLPGVLELVGLFVIQALLLALLVSFLVVAIELGSTALVNLIVLGLFFQVLTLLVTLTDEFSGALTLVVAGVVLLVVAVGLERGRRRVMDRLAPR